MQLSPTLYHKLIRPQWFVKNYIESTLNDYFQYKNKTIIDFGCGVGSLTPLFNPKHYIGLDCDAKRVAYAKYLHPGYRFYTLSENHIPLQNESVDFIFFISVLHHISTKDMIGYFSEFERVLKRNGSIIVMEPCLMSNKKISNLFMQTFDRGKFIRTKNEYFHLFEEEHYNIQVKKQFSQLFFYNKILFSATPEKKEATL